MEDLTNCLITVPEIRYCIPHNRDAHSFIEEHLKQYGLYPGQIHVWEHDGQLAIVSGFVVVEKCMSLQVDGEPAPIPICEQHIVRHKFQDIVEAKYWRACHMMARPHMTKVQRCKAWFEMKPVFEEIGRRRMSEAGKRKRSIDELPWDTTKKLEGTFRISRKTAGMYEDVMMHGTIQLRVQMENEEISITAAHKTLDLPSNPPKPQREKKTKPSAAARISTAPVRTEAETLDVLVNDAAEDTGPSVPYEIVGGAEFVSYMNYAFNVKAILAVITDTQTRSLDYVAFYVPVELKNQYENCGQGESVEDVVKRILGVSNDEND